MIKQRLRSKLLIYGFTLGLYAIGTEAIAYEMRATFNRTCPTSDAPISRNGQETLGAPLLLGIASSLAGGLVDEGIARLKKTVNPDAASIDATSFLQEGFYSHVLDKTSDAGMIKINPGLGCLVVVIGEFKGGINEWQLPFETDKGKTNAIQTLRETMSLSAPPMYYFEASIFPSLDKSAVTWQPTRLYVGEFLNNSIWAGKSRGILITVKLNKPGSSNSSYTQEFKYEAVEKGLSKNRADLLAASQGTWGTLPTPTSPPPKDAAPTPNGSPFDPFNLIVQIVESPKPYSLAIAAVDAIDANKQSIKSEVDQIIDPAKRQTAIVTSQSSTLTAINTYLDSWQKAVDACTVEKKAFPSGGLHCQVATDRALLDKAKAANACDASEVPSCRSINQLSMPT